jgi:hypothetical protein
MAWMNEEVYAILKIILQGFRTVDNKRSLFRR